MSACRHLLAILLSAAWLLAGDTAPTTQNNALQGGALVNALCVTCHSTMLIDNARKTSGDWKKTLLKMQKQGMPELPPALLETLVQYLATARGIPTDNNRQNRGPWADWRNANPLW